MISVIIPTYQRPKSLELCLNALKLQSRLPNELLIVVRNTDKVTWDFLELFDSGRLPIYPVTVYLPGTVAARNAGLDAATGEIIAFTDDDTRPHPDWLSRIESHFQSDTQLGGLGGRDCCYNGTELEDGTKEVVGKIQWFGRIIGNHHLGVGNVREVDVLKGDNMTFRQSAIGQLRFDKRLRGTGAQPYEDMTFSLAVKCSGWKIIYDPAVVVDHHSDNTDNPRSYVFNAQQEKFNKLDMMNLGYNQTIMLWGYLSLERRIAFLIWSSCIGSKHAPGFLQAIRLTFKLKILSWQRYIAFQQGQFLAIIDLLKRESCTESSVQN